MSFVAKEKEHSEEDLSIADKIIFEKFRRPISRSVLKKSSKSLKKNRKNIPGTKIIAEKLVKHARANILEIGLFQYITYSHRSRKEIIIPKIKDTGTNNDGIKIEIKDTKVVWIVIPDLMESYTNEKDYYNVLKTEIEYCKNIEKMLNNGQDEEYEISNEECRIY
ncbi:hypothetical protein C2G38_2069024, partial [Gigaspora rosea]